MMIMIILLLTYPSCLVIMQILVIHRLAWRRTVLITLASMCDANIVMDQNLIGDRSLDRYITCDVGCSGILGLALYKCTDFSDDEDWSTGEYDNVANLTGVTYFEAL